MLEVEPIMKWAVERVLPREVRKLASAIKEKDAALAHPDEQIEPLEFTNEEEKQTHQQALEEKDAALPLLTDDLQDYDNQIQAIQYENVALQAQRDVYQAQLQRCQDTITHLRTRYVDHARDPGKGNITIIVRKHTTPANDKFHDLPYYVARIQRCKRYVKLRWFDRHFPDHEVIVETHNPKRRVM